MSRPEGRKSSSFKYNHAVPVLSSFAPKKTRATVVDAKNSGKGLQVIVNYDYTYSHKGKKVEIFKDEVLDLIHETNEHWWKCSRGGVSKGFYVPAQYVSVMDRKTSDLDKGQYSGDSLSGSESRSASEENLVDSCRERIRSRIGGPLQTSKSIDSYHQLDRASPQLVILKDIDIAKSGEDEHEGLRDQSMDSIPSMKPVFPEVQNLKEPIRGSFRRLKCDDKLLSAAASLGRIDSEANCKDGIYNSVKETKRRLLKNTSISTSGNLSEAAKKDSYWSKSLEELSKQIVFPGQGPARSDNEEEEGEGPSTMPTIFFNNPGFQASSTGAEVSNIQISSGAEIPSRLATFTTPSKTDKEPAPPPKPPIRPRTEDNKNCCGLTKTVIKIGKDSHENLVTENDPVSLPANVGKITEQQDSLPPSSTEKKSISLHNLPSPSNESLDRTGEAVFLDTHNTSGTSQNSLASSSNDDEIPEPSEELLNRSMPNNWSEYKCPQSERMFYYNSVTHGKSWKPPRLSKSESNNNSVFNVPPGWTQRVDETSGIVSFINKSTGSEWLTSTDPSGRLYFYEKDSAKSSWVLPDSIDVTQNIPSSSQRLENRSSSAELSEQDDVVTPVIKRHSAGERENRAVKSKSLFMPSSSVTVDKGGSLPRTDSIWAKGYIPTVCEGSLNWTKIFDKHKKVKKNWTGSQHAVLTATHLSFFKDKNQLSSNPIKSELEIDLRSTTCVDWNTEHRSSRKHVFIVSSNDIQVLCQAGTEVEGSTWISNIDKIRSEWVRKEWEDERQTDEERSMSFMSTSLPTSSMDSLEISKRKSTSKSAKLTITDDDRKNSSRSQFLVRFFHRRPSKEVLVKKGIYKDEPVFGCTLEKLSSVEKTSVPKFVERCIQVIESKEENMKTDGIYRASGNLSQVQKIRLEVDQDNLTILEQEEDVHVLAGSLKLFFRELKEPAIPASLFQAFLNASHHRKDEKLSEFKKLVKKLPRANFDTLKLLFGHLLKVSSRSEFNRMEIQNIAIVFGPTLMWNASECNNMVSDLMQQNYVVEILLKEYQALFG